MIINLFGGPGSGKSTLASLIFSEMKLKNINCELVTEYAKQLTWQDRQNTLKNQLYVLGKQLERIRCCYNTEVISSKDIAQSIVKDLLY